MENTRQCRTCGEIKSPDDFYLHYNKRKHNTPRLDCKTCESDRRLKQASKSPEAFMRRLCSQLRSARRKRGEECDISTDDIIALYHEQDGKCALSGIQMTYKRSGKKLRTYGHITYPTNISVDRIDPNGPYELSNIQLVCNAINFMKWCWPEEDFIDWCSRVHGKRRGKGQGDGAR